MGETVQGTQPTGLGDGDRTLAAVAYILTWLTGLIIYLVADDDDRYARFHAIQAIGLGVVAIVVGWILGLAGGVAGFGGGSPIGFLGFGLLGGLWSLLVIVLIIVLAVKTYQGETIRLPVLADFADDHA